MPTLFAAFTIAFVSTAAAVDTFTASIVLPQGHQVLPGEPLPIQIWGLLSNATPGNGGLAYFRMDFAISGPETITLGDALVLGPPADGSMDNFVRPLGYDMGYGGTAVGDELIQAGGAQNVIGNNPAKEPMVNAPSAELVVFGVAHTEQLLLEGAITFPPGAAAGSYTVSLQNANFAGR